MRKIELQIMSISHSVSQAHSYAILLSELDGLRRLPIVIGGFEAQAIAVALEGVKPARPLTHDLIKNIFHTFDIELKEVIIDNLQDGVFFAKLVCRYGNQVLEIDSRTSDALALAVRFKCPVYTYEFVLDSAGIIMEDLGPEEAPKSRASSQPQFSEKAPTVDLSKLSSEELTRMLQRLLEREDYEKAIEVRDEISRRQRKQT